MIVDPQPTNQTISSARISLILSIVILAIKFGAYAMTHSQAVFSDALESIVNVLTAGIALVVMKMVAEPADEEHPYGHGKLEYFSSAFEGGMIAFAALAIGYEAVKALIVGSEVHDLETGMIVVAVAAFLNFLLGMHLRAVGKKYLSEALTASSAHVLSDVWTTLGIVGGLLLVKLTGWQWLDPAIALVVAIMLAASGVKIVRKAAGGLIDEVDMKAVESLVAALNQNRKPGLIDVHNTRIIRSGRFHHVDAHLVVPDFWDAVKVHTESHEFEQKVVATYPFDGEFAFHVDPCRQLFCPLCDLEDCPIRLKPLIEKRNLTVTSVIKGPDYGNHD